MSYFEFEDVKRLHQPYQDSMLKSPTWKAPFYNSPYMNMKRALYATTGALLIHEPIHHFVQHCRLLNSFYEWPKNRAEANIFFREVFRMEGYWKELGKKMAFGFVQHGADTGMKLASW